MSGRILCSFVVMMLASGLAAQAQQPAAPVESSKAELEEFAKGCAAVYLMAADTAKGDDLSQAMVRGASTVDYYKQSTGHSQERVNSDITDMRDKLTERLAQNPQLSLKELRANCDAAFAPAGG
ncbi:hypothetical protein [Asticcacaulis sp.]|uniref:hypothetical protein n=1 Tax=Asticcacaulis sp. TaxID=1872648 RepID=UPI002BC8929F|nr:hypothetical protein [Asticcacaulis sp.]HTM82122.1 hypothetical protein [Asticcacaulis sp.]